MLKYIPNMRQNAIGTRLNIYLFAKPMHFLAIIVGGTYLRDQRRKTRISEDVRTPKRA